MMEFPKEFVENVLSGSWLDRWDTFKSCILEDMELYWKIRTGIELKFDIHDVYDGYVVVKPKTNVVIVAGQSFRLSEYRTELNKRDAIMIQYFLENLAEDSTAPRDS